MNRIVLFSLAVLISSNVGASTLDCNDLYVGAINQTKGYAPHIVFKNNKDDGSGSHVTFLTGMTESEQQTAISILLAAKMSGHRVTVRTTETSGCDIQTGARNLKWVQLTNNP